MSNRKSNVDPRRWFWLLLGLLSVGLATLGLFLPLLPTVPFLLLATFAFGRSSERLQQWLYNHRWFGPILQNYLRHKGLTHRQLYTALTTLWLGIILGCYLAPLWHVRIFLAAIAIGVTIHLWRMNRLD
ncbi:YbaN family protein [Ferrimonas senticii]|uniref:YbaN family protein n=1 Tax=Ferrimonas senticii TaxID=394566 RepID=UPI0003F575B2|nr:YbaN family protein [Ferrimonas senticii]